jgi:hypothetical protein
MGPKVEACLRFAAAGGGDAVIASLTEVGAALAGEAGTHIVPDAAGEKAAGRESLSYHPTGAGDEEEA